MDPSTINPGSTDAQISTHLAELEAQRRDVETIECYSSGIQKFWLFILKPLCREVIRLRARTESLESRVKTLEGLLDQK